MKIAQLRVVDLITNRLAIGDETLAEAEADRPSEKIRLAIVDETLAEAEADRPSEKISGPATLSPAVFVSISRKVAVHARPVAIRMIPVVALPILGPLMIKNKAPKS